MNRSRQVFGVLGIVSAAVILISVIFSIVNFEDGVYSPAHCFVTELGLYTGGYFTASSALIFNIGIIISGLLLCAFMFYTGLQKNTVLNMAFSFIGMLTGVLIAALGIFTLNYTQYHYVVTIAFGISVFVLCVLYIIDEMLSQERSKLGLAKVIVAFISGITSALFAGYMLSGGMAQIFAQDAEAARQSVMPFALIHWAAFLLIFAFIALAAVPMLTKAKANSLNSDDGGIAR